LEILGRQSGLLEHMLITRHKKSWRCTGLEADTDPYVGGPGRRNECCQTQKQHSGSECLFHRTSPNEHAHYFPRQWTTRSSTRPIVPSNRKPIIPITIRPT